MLHNTQIERYSLEDFLGGVYYSLGLAISFFIEDIQTIEIKVFVAILGSLISFIVSYYEIPHGSVANRKILPKFSLLSLFYALAFLPSFLPETNIFIEFGLVGIGLVVSLFVSKSFVINNITEFFSF